MYGLKVLVVGASIAGPSTAYWLAKAGAQVTVIERFPELRRAGQAVDIRTAGVSVMRKIQGMEAQVKAKSTQEEGICFVDDKGEPLGTIRATGNPDQQSLISEYEILRGDLSTILFDLTKDNENIRYVFSEQVSSMQHKDSEDGPTTVEFMNGSAKTEYDLVVACDGAASRTRAMGLNCGVRDHVVSANIWTAYFSVPDDLLNGSKIGHGCSAVRGRAVTINTDPGGFSRVMLMNIDPGDKNGSISSFQDASSQGIESVKKLVSQHYQDVGWKTQQALHHMMSSDDFYASEIMQVKLPNIYKGRFVLVGDAGYAAGPTGGGTSLGLTGGYMLAGEISKHPGDLQAGLKAYEERMRPIITELQKIPPLVATIFAPQTAWGIWIRNNLFAFVAWTGIAEFFQKYLGAAFASTDTFPLPEYEWVK